MMDKRGAGFSLIEVLVALLILSIGLLAVAKLQVAAINSLSFSRHQSTAIQLGQQQLEFLRALPLDLNMDNPAVRDQNGNLILSNMNGTWGSPFRDNTGAGDGQESTWHSHWNNPMNALGEPVSDNFREREYWVRWTIERGPRFIPPAFVVPGVNQIRIRLQVIWFENPSNRPTSHVSTWDTNSLRNRGGHIVELITLRQVDM